MLVIKKYSKENISILFVLICFSFVAIFNAFMHIGIIEDGCHHFWEALVSENIWIGHDGTSSFPFNSRYFPSLIQHLSVGILALLGITNIKTLLFIFTLTSYLLPILVLLIIYLNIPREKRNCFEVILLYFLTCMNFMIHQIWTENFLTGLFLWVVFVIYYYNDFDQLSKFNLITLIIFSIFLISSHPMTAVFVIPMMVFAIIKQYRPKNVSSSTKKILVLSYILLFVAFIFNLYFIFQPIYPPDDYLLFEFFKEPSFIYFFMSVFFILIISLINNVKLKWLFRLFCFFVCFGMLYFVAFEINSDVGYPHRTLGFYVPLTLMLFILFKDFFKFVMNYNYIKSINFILLIIFLMHSVYYGISWNKYLIDVKNTITTKEQVKFIHLLKYRLFHVHTLPYNCVLISKLFDVNQNDKIIVHKKGFFHGHVKKIKRREKELSKFNINVNIFKMEKGFLLCQQYL